MNKTLEPAGAKEEHMLYHPEQIKISHTCQSIDKVEKTGFWHGQIEVKKIYIYQ